MNKTFSMDPALAAKLNAVAWEQRREISELLELILDAYFKEYDKSHRMKISHILEDEEYKEYAKHKKQKYIREKS